MFLIIANNTVIRLSSIESFRIRPSDSRVLIRSSSGVEYITARTFDETQIDDAIQDIKDAIINNTTIDL